MADGHREGEDGHEPLSSVSFTPTPINCLCQVPSHVAAVVLEDDGSEVMMVFNCTGMRVAVTMGETAMAHLAKTINMMAAQLRVIRSQRKEEKSDGRTN